MSCFRKEADTPDVLFSMIEKSYPLSDFLIRMDLMGCLASGGDLYIEAFLRQNWEKVFRSIVYTKEIEKACTSYFSDHRLGLKLLSKGTPIQSRSVLKRTLVCTAVLRTIAMSDNSEADLNTLNAEILSILRKDVDSGKDIETTTAEIIRQYFSNNMGLSPATATLLSQYLPQIDELYRKLCTMYNAYLSSTVEKAPTTPGDLFYMIEKSYSHSDFLIRMDLMGCLASEGNLNIETFLQQNWEKVFPTIAYTKELEKACAVYFSDFRLGFKLLAKGDPIEKLGVLKRVFVCTAVLISISAQNKTDIDSDALEFEATSLLRKDAESLKGIESLTEEILRQYFAKNGDVFPSTITMLAQHKTQICELYQKLSESVSSFLSASNKKEPASITPLRYAQFACLLLISLHEHNLTGSDMEDSIRAKWPTIFPKVPFTDKSWNEISDIVFTDPTFSAIKALFKYQLKNITNGRIVRTYVVALCTFEVLSKMPHRSSKDCVIDEAASLFSQFSGLSVGREEDDIDNFLSRFVTEDNVIDERVSALFWEHEKSISALYKNAIDDVTSVNSARKRFWWEEILNKKEQQMQDLRGQLEKQLDTAKANTMYSLIELLTSSPYNFVLSRLYRFAYEFDDLSESELRICVKDLIQVFRQFGVVATKESLIGSTIQSAIESNENFVEMFIPDFENNQIVFPEWVVFGDTVIPPVGTKSPED